MKKTIIVGTLLLAATGIANAASDTSTATVTIENQAISLTNTQGLNFGTVLPYGRNGTVTVNANGQGSASSAYISDASAITASAWDVTGVPGAPYAVTLPPNNTVTVSNGTETMTVTGFTAAGGTQQTLDAAGNDSFTVGATLKVGANQPAGVYTGTYNVTVSYN
jgi:hypothetical protein